MVANTITMEQVGTTVKALSRIASTGSVYVQLTLESSDVERSPDVVLSEIPGRKPVSANQVVTQQVLATVRLKSGTAVVVHSDSSQSMEEGMPQNETKLLILAATADPAVE